MMKADGTITQSCLFTRKLNNNNKATIMKSHLAKTEDKYKTTLT